MISTKVEIWINEGFK